MVHKLCSIPVKLMGQWLEKQNKEGHNAFFKGDPSYLSGHICMEISSQDSFSGATGLH